MKCTACGFEEKSHVVEYDEAVLFKSGKRKGEVREIKHVKYDVFETEPKFKEIFVARGTERGCYSASSQLKGERQFYIDDGDKYYKGFDSVGLFACPECGTVRMETKY